MSDEDVSASEIEDLLLPEDMPSDWSIRQIGDLKVMKNSRVKPEDMGEQNYVSLKHMGEGEPRIYEWESSEGVGSAKYEFQPGDIMLGKLRPYFRKVAMPKIDGICSTDINVIAATEEVDQKFLFYTLFRQEFIDIADKSSTGTRMPRADWSKLDKLNVALPPLEEQNRIGEFLHSIDEKIEVNRAMAEALEDIAHAIYTSWFVEYEPYTEFKESELGDIPEDFEVKGFGEFCGMRGGGTPSTDVDEYWDGDIDWITPKDVTHQETDLAHTTERTISEEGLNNSSTKVMPTQSVLLTSRAPVGEVVINRVPMATNQGFICLTPEGVTPYYLLQTVKSVRRTLEKRATGSTFTELSQKDLKSVNIPIPSIEAQERYDELVSPLYDYVHSLSIENESLEQTRDYLLPQLLSGEVRLGGDDA